MQDTSKNRSCETSVTDFGVRVAVVLRRRGEILLVRHEKPGREPYFVLPGGRLEPDETIPECAVREMLEETGLAVEYARTLYVNEFLKKGRHTVDVTVEANLLEPDNEEAAEAILGSDPEAAAGEAPTLVAVEWVAREDLTAAGLLPESVARRVVSDTNDSATMNRDVYLGASVG